MSPQNEVLDLGHGVSATLVYCECTDPACDKSKPSGIIWKHPRPDGVECANSGYLPVDPQPSKYAWTLVSTTPLTLSPSLQCMRPECRAHGFITDGRWVPA